MKLPSPGHAAEIIPLLRKRDGQSTIVTMVDGRVFEVFNIAWGLDDGADYEHVTSNISPSVEGRCVDFFLTNDVRSVTCPIAGELLWSKVEG